MPRGKASGITLSAKDVPIIMGMVARDDRDHDIAAWFGVNQGRIAEAKDGKYGPTGSAAPAKDLPPKGPPGVKGRRLRSALGSAVDALKKGDAKEAQTLLLKAIANYDANEA